MAEKRTKADKALRRDAQLQEMAETRSEQTPDRRKGPIRSGEERRKINIPPPPGSPVRSGLDRRKGDRRAGSLPPR